MPDNLIPDQMMDAIAFAELVMAKEKKDRIRRSEATVNPMKFCTASEMTLRMAIRPPSCGS